MYLLARKGRKSIVVVTCATKMPHLLVVLCQDAPSFGRWSRLGQQTQLAKFSMMIRNCTTKMYHLQVVLCQDAPSFGRQSGSVEIAKIFCFDIYQIGNCTTKMCHLQVVLCQDAPSLGSSVVSIWGSFLACVCSNTTVLNFIYFFCISGHILDLKRQRE